MNNGYIITSLDRGIRIVEAILMEEKGLTPLELEERFSIPKTTIFRILYTLQSQDWVQKRGDRYIAGHRFIKASMQALSGMELRSISTPYLEKLSNTTGETSHIGVWAGKQVMLIGVCDGPKHIRIANRAGSLAPSYSSSVGKVLLAYDVGSANVQDFFRNEELKQHTSNTLTDLGNLARELDKIVEQGYAVDDREYHDNVRCVAAPVRNGFGNVIAAIGITATTLTLTPEKVPEVSKKVIAIADEISYTLGVQ